jgi:hypothetical protein
VPVCGSNATIWPRVEPMPRYTQPASSVATERGYCRQFSLLR